MIATGTKLDLGNPVIADKHCVGGVPGNRTTMIVVPILAALGVVVPKTSSRAITSPAGTADTMGVLAEVALPPAQLHRVVEQVGACIAWGGALDLAPDGVVDHGKRQAGETHDGTLAGQGRDAPHARAGRVNDHLLDPTVDGNDLTHV